MAMLETPSRIWRRLEEVEGQSKDMPSLPSLPVFEDSAAASSTNGSRHDTSADDTEDNMVISLPLQSTPAALSSHAATSTIRAPSSTSSTARFASSVASRSTTSRSAFSASRSRAGSSASAKEQLHYESFDISMIPSLPELPPHDMEISRYYEEDTGESRDSVPDVYLPPEIDVEEDASLTDALESVSRAGSPEPQNDPTPRKKYDYSISLRSEPKPSPVSDKYRNVALRKPRSNPRMQSRTPSLSRTTPSPSSSSSHSTPHSLRSIALPISPTGSPLPAAFVPLPRSTTASPAVRHSIEDAGDNLIPRGEDAYPPLELESEEHGNMHSSHSGADLEVDQPSQMLLPPSQHSLSRSENSRSRSTSSHDSREPTFSSEEGPTPASHHPSPYTQGLVDNRSLSAALSSPAPSATFTPTPAFPSRSRPRFNVQTPAPDFTPDDEHEEEGEETPSRKEGEEDILTPHARRRSFLLSVINSTTRPRMKFPTPHVNKFQGNLTPATTANITLSTAPKLRTAFAGMTPRNTARVGHPLKQTLVLGESESGGSGAEDRSPQEEDALARWSPSPALQSPYDSANERASFISTASSHDLTTHQRANASFDPIMNAGGHGVNRFNMVKLNSYLHGLNRRFQEENESLVKKLKVAEEELRKTKQGDGPDSSSAGRRGRRASAGGSALGNVEEDISGEGWVEEKKDFERLVEELRAEVQTRVLEKEQVERALEEVQQALDEEKGERGRDKERWRDRMGEVEKGVEGIVRELERKLQDAEKRAKVAVEDEEGRLRAFERRLAEAEAERDAAVNRARKAEEVLESGQELGGELREVNERMGDVMGDLRNANAQIKELENEVLRSDGRVDELEKELDQEKALVEEIEQELQEKATMDERANAAEEKAKKAEEELRLTKAYVLEIEEDTNAAVQRIESLQEQLGSANDQILKLEAEAELVDDRLDLLEGEKERAAELARQMEEALEAAEKKMLEDENEVLQLKGNLASLQRELERDKEKSFIQNDNPSFQRIAPEDHADIEALEDELDAANREIARLTTILQQSPARKAMEKAKDAKIEILEREKEELAERVKLLKNTIGGMANTPNRTGNASGISPIHRQVLSMRLRTPKTPGTPLKDLSWLNNTAADPTVSPLLEEIARLQQELDRANESIDDKLDKLEDAGLGVVGLTKKLEDARARIVTLEEEILRLGRREDRRIKRLERMRCLKCHVKIDLRGLTRAAEGDESSLEISQASLPSEPPTPPTRTSDALRTNLQSVNAQLETMKRQWEDEKRQLIGEKAMLQDAANRLNMQVRSAKDEVKNIQRAGERARVGVQEELDMAKQTMAELEADLTAERAQLRGLTTEQNRVHRDKENILLQLRRTESDMDSVKRQLQRFKQENRDLETELRMNANAEQKARLLEVRVTENSETIEQLRQERFLLVADHKELQHRFSEITERANRLRDEHAASQTSHDNRRHQLDLRLLEIEELRTKLSSQATELQRAEYEKKRIVSEKNDVARMVAALEADLKRVRKDAELFGKDLKSLRAEKEKLEADWKEESTKAQRAKKQAEAQLRLLNEQLDRQREKTTKAQSEMQAHVCALDEGQLTVMKLQHNKECKGLIVQIRYLKAKFSRESALRCDLGYQKQYLLVLLSRHEKSERTILASIASIGFPLPNPPKKKRSLKGVILCAVFLTRARRASENWREQCASKGAIAAALQDVRQRRAVAVAPL